MNIVNFYNILYKKYNSTQQRIANKFLNRENNCELQINKNNKTISIKYKTNLIDPEFLYDYKHNKIGFNFGTVDLYALIELNSIFKKYFNLEFSLCTPAGKMDFDTKKLSIEEMINFCDEILNAIYNNINAKGEYNVQ